MKKLSAFLFIFLINIGTVCAVTVPDTMKEAMKGDSDMPSLLNLILSLLIVIAMIYMTGWIYQKLNKINKCRLGSNEYLEKNNFKVLSSLPLGQQKNLYAVEINDKILVLGSTAQNINLLKEFDKVTVRELAEKNNENEAPKTEKDEKAEGLELIYQKYKD